MSRRIVKNLVDLVTGTFVSRVLGFLRELVTAAYYGTNRAMDLFVIAFTIPTFFRHFLGEDVVERAFMPPFKKLISQEKYKPAYRLLSSCLNVMIAALIIFMILLYLIAPVVVKIIAPGLEDAMLPQAIKMSYWLLPFMVIIGLAAFVGSILNFFEMNKIYSLAPAIMSVGVILGIIYLRSALGIYALAAGFLIGGILELLIQIPFLFHKKIRGETRAEYSPVIEFREQEFRTVGRESGFIFLKAFVDKSIEIVDRILASYLITGSIAALWYAQRLIQLPVAIIGLAISRSLIPFLTEKKALVQEKEFIAGIRLGIQLNLALILPVIMIMVVMAEPIIGIVYQRGSFNQESTRMTSIAFWCYSVGLLGLSLNAFFSRLFSIFQKNKIPFYITIVTSSINILLDFILVKTTLKHGGIALAASIGFSLSSMIQFYFLLREINYQIRVGEVLKDFFNIGSICSLIGAGSFFFYHHALKNFLSLYLTSFFMQQLAGLLIISLFAMMSYFLFLKTLGPSEIRNRLSRLVR